MVQATQRECLDLEAPESSDVVVVTTTPDSDLDRPAKRPRTDIDLNVPAPEASMADISEPKSSVPGSITLTDIHDRQTETSTNQRNLAWMDAVVPGHTYRTCITAHIRTIAHISAMTQAGQITDQS